MFDRFGGGRGGIALERFRKGNPRTVIVVYEEGIIEPQIANILGTKKIIKHAEGKVWMLVNVDWDGCKATGTINEKTLQGAAGECKATDEPTGGLGGE